MMRRPTFQFSRGRLVGTTKVAAVITAVWFIVPLLKGEAPDLAVLLPMFPLMLIIAYQAWSALEPSFGRIGKGRAMEVVGVVSISVVVVIAATNAIVLLTGMREGYALLIFFATTILAYAAYLGIRRSWNGLSRPGQRSAS